MQTLQKEYSKSWHLFLECNTAKFFEKRMLVLLGKKENKAENFIELRKKITKEGSKKSELQNLMWTRNWAIWKCYNDYTHGRIKPWQNLEVILLVKLSLEEFRTLNFVKVLKEKVGKCPSTEWNNWTLIYKFNLQLQFQILPKNKNITEKFWTLMTLKKEIKKIYFKMFIAEFQSIQFLLLNVFLFILNCE